jgi:RNA polymerase sigma factor (sigma-70 family)
MEDDLYLWHCFLSGDEQAFIRLYDKYVREMFVYGLRYTTDKELLKDAIQDTLVNAYNDKNKSTHIKNIQSYLYTSLKNNLISLYKKNQIHLRYIQLSERLEVDENTGESDLIEKEQEQDKQDKIKKIMSVLSSQQQKVIYYRFIENKTIEEISAILSINYQSVQNIIQRSIKKTKDFFFEK